MGKTTLLTIATAAALAMSLIGCSAALEEPGDGSCVGKCDGADDGPSDDAELPPIAGTGLVPRACPEGVGDVAAIAVRQPTQSVVEVGSEHIFEVVAVNVYGETVAVPRDIEFDLTFGWDRVVDDLVIAEGSCGAVVPVQLGTAGQYQVTAVDDAVNPQARPWESVWALIEAAPAAAICDPSAATEDLEVEMIPESTRVPVGEDIRIRFSGYDAAGVHTTFPPGWGSTYTGDIEFFPADGGPSEWAGTIQARFQDILCNDYFAWAYDEPGIYRFTLLTDFEGDEPVYKSVEVEVY